jgi:hypothetical protein
LEWDWIKVKQKEQQDDIPMESVVDTTVELIKAILEKNKRSYDLVISELHIFFL